MKRIFIYGEAAAYGNYAAALAASGASPVFDTKLNTAASCQGLLLVGGADVSPHQYHAANTHSAGIDNTRDTAELQLIATFAASNRPILGICRGIQVLNVALGGSLTQHVSHPARHSRENQPTDKYHLVHCMTQSFLTDLYGCCYTVNSAHHQSIKVLAPDLLLLACAEDGVIEAVQHKSKPIFAVQWHPERLCLAHKHTAAVDGTPIFTHFLSFVPTQ